MLNGEGTRCAGRLSAPDSVVRLVFSAQYSGNSDQSRMTMHRERPAEQPEAAQARRVQPPPRPARPVARHGRGVMTGRGYGHVATGLR